MILGFSPTWFSTRPGSPAEAAGLRKGQRVVSIDGTPVGEAYLDGGFRWTFGKSGTEVVLTDDLGRDIRVVLADYF